MSKYNTLNENDELIKSLREKQTDNKDLKKSISKKIKDLESIKTVYK